MLHVISQKLADYTENWSLLRLLACVGKKAPFLGVSMTTFALVAMQNQFR
jgi:hypothetical protein